MQADGDGIVRERLLRPPCSIVGWVLAVATHTTIAFILARFCFFNNIPANETSLRRTVSSVLRGSHSDTVAAYYLHVYAVKMCSAFV